MLLVTVLTDGSRVILLILELSGSPGALEILKSGVPWAFNSAKPSHPPLKFLPPGEIRRWENLSKKDPPVCPSANTIRKMINKCVDFITLNTNCGVVLQSLISKKFSYISGLTHRYVLQARPLWNPLDVNWCRWLLARENAVAWFKYDCCSLKGALKNAHLIGFRINRRTIMESVNSLA